MKDWYWRCREFEGLALLAESAREHPEWAQFSELCALQERGLRKQALVAVAGFIREATSWAFPARREFASFLLNYAQKQHDFRTYITHPLKTRLILPTLEEWREREPGNVEPWRWLGILQHDGALLGKAVELSPTEQIARIELIDFITVDADYAVHELPYGFLGNPDQVLTDLAEAEALVGGIADAHQQAFHADEVRSLMALVTTYRDWKTSDSKEEFVDWAKDHGRPARP